MLGISLCVPSPCTLCFRLCEKQIAQLQGAGARREGADPGPMTHNRCPKRLSPLESTEKCPGHQKGLNARTERGIFKMSNFQGRDENAGRGWDRTLAVSWKGKSKGGSLSFSSTNPHKVRRNTTFLPHHTYSYPPPPKKSIRVPELCFTERLGIVKLGIT